MATKKKKMSLTEKYAAKSRANKAKGKQAKPGDVGKGAAKNAASAMLKRQRKMKKMI